MNGLHVDILAQSYWKQVSSDWFDGLLHGFGHGFLHGFGIDSGSPNWLDVAGGHREANLSLPIVRSICSSCDVHTQVLRNITSLLFWVFSIVLVHLTVRSSKTRLKTHT